MKFKRKEKRQNEKKIFFMIQFFFPPFAAVELKEKKHCYLDVFMQMIYHHGNDFEERVLGQKN
jgi:hypothetical protein